MLRLAFDSRLQLRKVNIPPLLALSNDGSYAAENALAFCIFLLVAIKDLSADTETMTVADGGDFGERSQSNLCCWACGVYAYKTD